MSNVLVIGAWHLGSVVGACLADCGNTVSLWDQNPKVGEKWAGGLPPIHEPGLQDLATQYWGKSLFWTTPDELSEVSKNSDWIIVAYDTPVNDQDEIVFDIVEEGFSKVLNAGFSDKACFFFTAQLPVGTSRRFLTKIREINPSWNGRVYYMPENLRLGEALKSFKTPDRMVLGVDSDYLGEREKAVRQFRKLVADEKTPVNTMSLESAEMVKHALNAFLGTCVVFANEVSEICEKTGADAWDVMASLKQDSRVGPKAFLRPGLGFSGGTLARDVKTLSHLTDSKKTQSFFSKLYTINAARNDWIVNQLEENLKSLECKKVVLLGVTYKPFTSTVRRSPALEIGLLLKNHGVRCVALDPMADLSELAPDERAGLPFSLLKTAEEAFDKADGAIVVTEWPQFLEYDFTQIKKLMTKNLIIDSKNLFSKHQDIHKVFKVIVPGKPKV